MAVGVLVVVVVVLQCSSRRAPNATKKGFLQQRHPQSRTRDALSERELATATATETNTNEHEGA